MRWLILYLVSQWKSRSKSILLKRVWETCKIVAIFNLHVFAQYKKRCDVISRSIRLLDVIPNWLLEGNHINSERKCYAVCYVCYMHKFFLVRCKHMVARSKLHVCYKWYFWLSKVEQIWRRSKPHTDYWPCHKILFVTIGKRYDRPVCADIISVIRSLLFIAGNNAMFIFCSASYDMNDRLVFLVWKFSAIIRRRWVTPFNAFCYILAYLYSLNELLKPNSTWKKELLLYIAVEKC